MDGGTTYIAGMGPSVTDIRQRTTGGTTTRTTARTTATPGTGSVTVTGQGNKEPTALSAPPAVAAPAPPAPPTVATPGHPAVPAPASDRAPTLVPTDPGCPGTPPVTETHAGPGPLAPTVGTAHRDRVTLGALGCNVSQDLVCISPDTMLTTTSESIDF